MKKAFTLIEAVVALGIFGIGVLALASFFAYSAQTVRIARETTVATNLSQGLIEEAISQPYDSLVAGAGTRSFFAAPNNLYEKQTNITLIDMNLNNSATDVGLKKIDCFVYWNSSSGAKQVQTTTIVSEK